MVFHFKNFKKMIAHYMNNLIFSVVKIQLNDIQKMNTLNMIY